MASPSAPFPHTTDSVRAAWNTLHQGDAEPLPPDPAVLDAWVLFHRGEFQAAAQAGLALGPAGLAVSSKSICLQATHLESRESERLVLLHQVVTQTQQQVEASPADWAAAYWLAYALGRYSQGISVSKALAQGLGQRIKSSLETCIALQPHHADAHLVLGGYHAEVIDKVGSLIGWMTHGARRDTALALFERALALNPLSVIGRIEYAHALVMLDGPSRLAEATHWTEQAASHRPRDAMEGLHVAQARAELAD